MIKWNTLRKQKEEEQQHKDKEHYLYYKTRAISNEMYDWDKWTEHLRCDYINGMIGLDEYYAGMEGAAKFLTDQLNSINKIDDVETLKKWV